VRPVASIVLSIHYRQIADMTVPSDVHRHLLIKYSKGFSHGLNKYGYLVFIAQAIRKEV